jgi:hypothetical protein
LRFVCRVGPAKSRGLAGHPATAVKTRIEVVFEDLNYEELKRRANSRFPDRVVATLEAHGERRSVAAGEALYRVEDRQYPLVYAISATLQLRDPDGMVLGVMDPGQFTGELALLFGQTAFADCIVTSPGVMVRLDDRGFVQTGEGCGPASAPFNVFQTTLPGVFAVGDVRSGSVKRVASAVGEGSVVVQAIHARLAALRQAEGREPVTL